MYLVDTTILSATDPTKKVIDVDLIYWMSAASSHLYLSAVTASEVVAGIAKARGVWARAGKPNPWVGGGRSSRSCTEIESSHLISEWPGSPAR
jgi:hypothetical protein